MIICLSCTCGVHAQGSAEDVMHRISSLIADKRMTAGVAWMADGKVWSINDSVRYPMMSVFKFPVVYSVLRKMQDEGTPLSRTVCVKAGQMHKDTYSPMLKAFPDRDFHISLARLMRYCISESDNNACDILIDYLGGIGCVSAEIRRLGVCGLDISETEASMHADAGRCYNNWSTPSAMVRLMGMVYEGGVISGSYLAFLERIMKETVTGADKMRAGLPADVVLGHKTGSSGRTTDGIKAGDNDAGVIYMPNGRRCYAAIFIRDSEEDDRTNAKMIAEITGAVFSWLREARYENKIQYIQSKETDNNKCKSAAAHPHGYGQTMLKLTQ